MPKKVIKLGDLVYDDNSYLYTDHQPVGLVTKIGTEIEGINVLWSNGRYEVWDYETFCLYHSAVKNVKTRRSGNHS